MNKLAGEFILNREENKSAPEVHETSTAKKLHTAVKKSPHFYSSYCENPSHVRFAEQEEGEDIVLLLRRHFVTNVPWLFASLLLIFLPLAIPFVLRNFPFPMPETATVTLYLAFYYLMIFGFLLINFTLWYFHIGLVTTHRVIDIDLAGVLFRQVTEAKHQNIEDVTYKQVGFVTSLFNYGDVTVQTAGNEANLEYDRVPRPSEVADIIGDLSQHA